ncbi:MULTISPECIES: DsbA family oxidoreductase [Shewanella]|uniref:DsbA family oxidoreductase n=1 Tax=Shewanella holmiensis TaxID=2952222 RepID=A0A9X2WQW4_9GAMM|nr:MULTISPECIES: DsbA family oxidoreductase [Shewanella]MCT7943688.1 DsbA family oxidoreductase [Shewanella holmiensis]MDP5146047.1 DsbA family oxidoreductase [Shewanella sp. ULN5]
MAPKTLQIDIVSDVMCPWCIVGYKRLQQALSTFTAIDVQITWHPFELNPDMGKDGQHLGEHLAEKYGSTPQQSQQNRANLTAIGKTLDIAFNFTDQSRIYNTFNAHQLLQWAKSFNKQTALKLALFEAYFQQQQNIADNEVLLNVVETVGLDRELAKTVLASQQYANTVRAEQSLWQGRGISAVPAIVFNQQYLISGAQSAEYLVETIKQLQE